jgi:predicted O-methyltransferase YrrM
MKEDFFSSLSELEEIAKVLRVTRNIDGWLADIEGAALYYVAKYGPSIGKIVEIGSFKGKSTVLLTTGSKQANREHVHAIDPHKGSSEHQPGGEFASHMPAEGTTELVFRQNISQAGVEDWVQPMIMSSEEAVRTWHYPIRLLFIDGDHTYDAVKADFSGWERFVVPGGLVAFHDVDRQDGSSTEALDGPTRVVYEDVAKTDLYSDPIIVNHLAFVSKIRHL